MGMPLSEKTLKQLCTAGLVHSARVVAQSDGGYGVAAHYGKEEEMLEGTRGKIRRFSLPAAAGYLRDLGFFKFEVDTTGFGPGLIRSPRPDRAEALSSTKTKPVQASLL